MISLPNLPHANKPVSVGWQFSTVMLLPTSKSSWGGILSQRRITSCEKAVAVASEQLEQIKTHLPADVRLLADRRSRDRTLSPDLPAAPDRSADAFEA